MNVPTPTPSPLSLAPKTLRSKALAVLAGSVLACTLTAYVAFNPLFAQTFEKDVNNRGQAMVQILEQHKKVRLALNYKGQQLATDVAQEIQQGDGDIRYVVLLDPDQHVLGSSGIGGEDLQRLLADTSKRSGDVKIIRLPVKRDLSGNEIDTQDLPSEGDANKPLGYILLGISPQTAR